MTVSSIGDWVSGNRGRKLRQARKVRENRLRRAARRQELTLHRSRRRDPRTTDYGVYWLADADGLLVTGTRASLDEVEQHLLGYRRTPKRRRR